MCRWVVASSTVQENYSHDPQIIVLSLGVTPSPLFVVIKSFTFDIGEIVYTGRFFSKIKLVSWNSRSQQSSFSSI